MSACSKHNLYNPYNPYKALASWVCMCADKWSPWLHMLRSDKYTVFDCVNVRFDEAMPLAIVEHIVDTWAYFEDSLGRQSRLTFLIDDDAEDCGPVYMTATSGAENIPWLLCVS